MMPKLDGYGVCQEIRKESEVPIIMLTALGDVADRITGLELGADDYVTKPYSARELVARIRAVLRRQAGLDDNYAEDVQVSAGPVKMDIDRHIVTVNGEATSLPLKEFELLEYLIRNAGRVLTRSQLIDRVWGNDYFGDTKTLDVHIKRLRAKIEVDPANPLLIQTVRGLGYKFEV
jgi:two-component system response regulator RegX3